KRLQRVREIVVELIDRVQASRAAVDVLNAGVIIRHRPAIGSTGKFGAQLPLHEDIELARDTNDPRADRARACRRAGLHKRLADVTGILGVGDILGNDADAGLRDLQTGERRGNCLSETHALLPSAATVTVSYSASLAASDRSW